MSRAWLPERIGRPAKNRRLRNTGCDERKAMTRLWAKRELQIQGVIESTVGLYGDLQGIAGTAMAAIEGLELPLLEEPGAA